jgi:hypothetical protein
MRALLNQRNWINVQIRDLHADIRRELGIPKDDFISAMRLEALAVSSRQQTITNISEILKALGIVSAPVLAPEALPKQEVPHA